VLDSFHQFLATAARERRGEFISIFVSIALYHSLGHLVIKKSSIVVELTDLSESGQ
jgi:hypothetical protein